MLSLSSASIKKRLISPWHSPFKLAQNGFQHFSSLTINASSIVHIPKGRAGRAGPLMGCNIYSLNADNVSEFRHHCQYCSHYIRGLEQTAKELRDHVNIKTVTQQTILLFGSH